VDHIHPWSLQRLGLLLAGLGRRERRLFAERAGGEEPFAVLAARGLSGRVLKAAEAAAAREAPALLERLAARGWRWVSPESADFPSLLLHVSDPPLGLFVRGQLDGGPAVAVVGSRRATAYGRQVAGLLGRELAAAGVTVVSGMARGVDAAAHRGALEAGGRTVAVWGTGPDRVYPREHAGLAEDIAASGALVTEYPPGTAPRRYHFPERNRILAGMAHATVVVEAAARSGALVTARLALDEGREVFAVPGNILSELSVGPNALLRLGAQPLLTARDALAVLPGVEAPAGAPAAAGEKAGDPLWGALGPGESLAVDEIAARSGRPLPEVLARILEAELEGRVVREADGRYSLAGA